MQPSDSAFRMVLSTLAWLLAACLLLLFFTERLYSQSADFGHHGVLVAYLMDSWHVVPDATLSYMAGYPRLAHLIASIPGVVLDSNLLGMQVSAILAIFLCWACIGICLLGVQTQASLRLLGLLTLVLVLNAVFFGIETFGHEIVSNYFFGHLLAQAIAFVLLAISLRSERKTGTPSRAYLVLAVGGPLLTATHLVPAAEIIATLGLLVVLNLPVEWPSSEGRRRTFIGLMALLASCALAVVQPAFHTMVWASANNGLTLLKYVPDFAHAIGLALVAAATSIALLFSWWRRRRDSHHVAILMKYLGAFGLATSGLCLLQALLLVALGLGSHYAVLKYMISLQSLFLVNMAVLASLFWRDDERRLEHKWTVVIPPAFGVIATCAALIPNSAISIDPIVTAERDARAFARAPARTSEKGQNIAAGMTGVPSVGNYLISRSALRAWDESTLFDLLIGKIPTNTDDVSHVLTSSGSAPWDVPRCRLQPSGALVVLDAACVFESFSKLPCSGTIEFSTPLPLDRKVTGFSNAEPAGRWTAGKEATMRCTVGDQAPKRMHIQASGLVTAQHRQHVEYKVNAGPVIAVDYSIDSPRQSISIDVPPDSGPELVLHISTPDAKSPEQLGFNADPRTLGVMIHDIRFE